MMNMQLVTAEKPGVANTIAKAPGSAYRKNGYIEGDNIINALPEHISGCSERRKADG